MHAPEDTVTLILAESERLTQYLTTLPPAAWRTPSACERWEVRDVVAHLTLQTEGYTDAIARSVQGDASPPAGRPWSGPTTAAAFAADTAQRALARRETLGDHVLAHFRTATAQLDPLLAHLGPADWDKPHYTPLGSAPLRHIPADWLVELVVHGWDIRSRLATDAPLAAASLPVVVEVSLGRACRWRFQPGPRLPTPIRYRVALTGGAPPRTTSSSQGIRPRWSLRRRSWPPCVCGVIRRRASCSCSDVSRWLTRWHSAAWWRKERGSRSPPLPSGFGGRDVEGTRVGRQAQARTQGMRAV